MTEYSWEWNDNKMLGEEHSTRIRAITDEITKELSFSTVINRRIAKKVGWANFYVDMGRGTIVIYDVDSEDNGLVDLLASFESFNSFLEWLDNDD